jgi:hypothetical protein
MVGSASWGCVVAIIDQPLPFVTQDLKVRLVESNSDPAPVVAMVVQM